MMRFLILTIIIQVISVMSETDDDIPVHHAREFDNYIKVFNRQYKSEDEKQHRLKTFSKNLIKIEELNQKYPHTVYGITSMADMTEEEKQNMLMKNKQKDKGVPKASARRLKPRRGKKGEKMSGYNNFHNNDCFEHYDYDDKNDFDYDNGGHNDNDHIDNTGFTDQEGDWRKKGKVTSVKNQGNCGSCWSFATVAVLESHMMIKRNVSYDFSEQDLLNCDTQSLGCNGGFLHTALDHVHKSGILMEHSAPYKGYQSTCRRGSGKVKSDGYKNIDKDARKIVEHIRYHGPVTAAFQVSEGFYYYKNGVFSECSGRGGYHAVAVVGYGKDYKSGRDYWIIKNSWGPEWGDNGYVLFERGRDVCGIESDIMSPVIYG